MRDYTVKKQKNGVITFKYNRRLMATIEKVDDFYWCRCAFHNGECISALYDRGFTALEMTVQYLEGLDPMEEPATFNKRINWGFILEML